MLDDFGAGDPIVASSTMPTFPLSSSDSFSADATLVQPFQSEPHPDGSGFTVRFVGSAGGPLSGQMAPAGGLPGPKR